MPPVLTPTPLADAAPASLLEAVGATLLVQYGWANAFWALLATELIIYPADWPISCMRHGVDMNLLTRGAGFGCTGCTVTSLIYATFSFIFFTLEAGVIVSAISRLADVNVAAVAGDDFRLRVSARTWCALRHFALRR